MRREGQDRYIVGMETKQIYISKQENDLPEVIQLIKNQSKQDWSPSFQTPYPEIFLLHQTAVYL